MVAVIGSEFGCDEARLYSGVEGPRPQIVTVALGDGNRVMITWAWEAPEQIRFSEHFLTCAVVTEAHLQPHGGNHDGPVRVGEDAPEGVTVETGKAASTCVESLVRLRRRAGVIMAVSASLR